MGAASRILNFGWMAGTIIYVVYRFRSYMKSLPDNIHPREREIGLSELRNKEPPPIVTGLFHTGIPMFFLSNEESLEYKMMTIGFGSVGNLTAISPVNGSRLDNFVHLMRSADQYANLSDEAVLLLDDRLSAASSVYWQLSLENIVEKISERSKDWDVVNLGYYFSDHNDFVSVHGKWIRDLVADDSLFSKPNIPFEGFLASLWRRSRLRELSEKLASVSTTPEDAARQGLFGKAYLIQPPMFTYRLTSISMDSDIQKLGQATADVIRWQVENAELIDNIQAFQTMNNTERREVYSRIVRKEVPDAVLELTTDFRRQLVTYLLNFLPRFDWIVTETY